MRSLLIDTCVAILRKLNCSVIIGYEIHGDIRAKNDWARIYDNDLDVVNKLPDGTIFDIPNGKFSYKAEVQVNERN